MNELHYLGVAMQSPVHLLSGRAALISGVKVVEQSIVDILRTPVGTRLFLPEYGSRLHELTFEQNDEILIGAARMLIIESIAMWERRTRFIDLQHEAIDENTVIFRLFHQLLASNDIQSFIFPFYRKLQH